MTRSPLAWRLLTVSGGGVVTIEDALAGGCTLFNLEQLKRENENRRLPQSVYVRVR
ncbi:hypothetical protein MJ560_21530 [Klebsiella pneumoniae]|nr:hypothetical protein MJ560_21530 [Klebsiella pneumoniae]